jgi:hypothetical protein
MMTDNPDLVRHRLQKHKVWKIISSTNRKGGAPNGGDRVEPKGLAISADSRRSCFAWRDRAWHQVRKAEFLEDAANRHFTQIE